MEDRSLPTDHSTKAWRRCNILIVDDEPRILKQIENDLFAEDFSLITATSAEAGMALLNDNEIHVIVCDQKMPGGMNGTEFLYQARLNKPHIVGIILSAYGEPQYLLSAMNKAGAFRYLLKPWDKKELVDAILQGLQLCQINLLVESFKKSDEFKYKDKMFAQSIRELTKTQRSLQEAIYALASVSEFTGKISQVLQGRLKDSLGG